MKVRATLSHRYIKRFYIARFISNFGNGMGPIALAFGILHLQHGSAKELGLVLGALSVALLCMLPFGGVIADKYGRIKMCALRLPVHVPVMLAYNAPVRVSAHAVTTLAVVRLFAAVATPPIAVAPAIKPIASLEIVLSPLILWKIDIKTLLT